MKDRIKIFLEQSGLTAAQLADKIGVQRSSFSHILNGRNNPSADFIRKLLTTYSDLNANWLFGTSENMWLNQPVKNRNEDLFSGIDGETRLQKSKEKKEDEKEKHVATEKTIPSDSAETQGTLDRTAIKKIVFFHDNHTFTIYTPQ
jgi:transcriptional regulator with XRE-family HTH domain